MEGKTADQTQLCVNIQVEEWLSAQCVCVLMRLAQLGAVIPYTITCLSVILAGCAAMKGGDHKLKFNLLFTLLTKIECIFFYSIS